MDFASDGPTTKGRLDGKSRPQPGHNVVGGVSIRSQGHVLSLKHMFPSGLSLTMNSIDLTTGDVMSESRNETQKYD
jgi:hypothetical protein